MQHKTLVTTQAELDNLTKMRFRELIDDEMFIKQRNELQTKINELKEKLRRTEQRAVEWLKLTERTFNFATYAHSAFLKANEMGSAGLELKKEILMALGYSPKIKAGKLYIELTEHFAEIKNAYQPLEAKYLSLELTKMPYSQAQSESLAAIRTRWRRTVDKVRTYFQELVLSGTPQNLVYVKATSF